MGDQAPCESDFDAEPGHRNDKGRSRVSSSVVVSNQDQGTKFRSRGGLSKVAVMQMNVFVERGMMPRLCRRVGRPSCPLVGSLVTRTVSGEQQHRRISRMATVLIHPLERYKASRTSSLNICTDTVPLAPTLNHAPMPRDKRHRLSHRGRNDQLGASLSHFFGLCL